MLAHDEPREIVGALPHELPHAKADRRAFVASRAAPARERARRRRDRAIAVGGSREWELSSRFARGGIVDGAGAVGCAVVAPPGDPVIETEHVGLSALTA